MNQSSLVRNAKRGLIATGLFLMLVPFAIDFSGVLIPAIPLLRYIFTHHKVHVKIEAVAFGEPVILERTIRCYNRYFINLNPLSPGLIQRRVAQSVSLVGSTLKDGRLVYVNLPELCSYAGSHYGECYQNTGIPVFMVADRMKNPSVVDMYVNPDSIIDGRDGIKLTAIQVGSAVDGDPLVSDWDAIDEYQSDTDSFLGYYVKSYPRETWSKYPDMTTVLEQLKVPSDVTGMNFHMKYPGYPSKSGWLTELDPRWISFGQVTGNFKVINPEISDVHPVLVRDRRRYVDTSRSGIISFFPYTSYYREVTDRSYTQTIALNSVTISSTHWQGIAIIFDPRESALYFLEGEDLR